MLYYLFQGVWSLLCLLALSTSLLYCTNCRNCFSEMLFVVIKQELKVLCPILMALQMTWVRETWGWISAKPLAKMHPNGSFPSEKIMENFSEYIGFASTLLGPHINIAMGMTVPTCYPCQSGVPWHRAGQGIHQPLLMSLLKEPQAAVRCFASLCFTSALIPLF